MNKKERQKRLVSVLVGMNLMNSDMESFLELHSVKNNTPAHLVEALRGVFKTSMGIVNGKIKELMDEE